ncbi:sigma-70 family RNA polymerase sigma factor [Roseivirga sp.]|jgi:RNA polymerase sigma-70 factor (ECF subfamily)|uniref:RNA polymerase sigma factor n=1 Tax=Roseivirga sp. TaxID=1964215 RepID=UPI000D7A08D6|nr:sigma-70 family RNA polymerase sigma factor [Roseivirga sp.]MBO6496516.1 sigma-70 family RNA polymerase sigma factor [Roseivirga sp.]PWL27939.1 MAG: RNA polymerase subunit sigma-24 [Roseivirga sp. XM-24bin3]
MELQEFKTKVLPLKDRLFRIAVHLLKSAEEAEDALQDVMVRLWDKRGQLKEYRSVEAFAVTVTKNRCLDKLKSKKHKYHLDVQELEVDSGFESPYKRLELSESMQVMIRSFQELPEQQRLLITLRDLEGYSYEEIAEQTGLQVNNIRVGLSRARKAAREAYLKVADYEQQ